MHESECERGVGALVSTGEACNQESVIASLKEKYEPSVIVDSSGRIGSTVNDEALSSAARLRSTSSPSAGCEIASAGTPA